eukprot:jgi/Orpsp1_1/1187239/evm.model.d7180000056284.1
MENSTGCNLRDKIEKSIDSNALRGIKSEQYEEISNIKCDSKDDFKNLLKNSINNNENKVKDEYFFECKINWKEIFNDNENNIFYCPEFSVDNYTWRIEINPRKEDYFSLYIDNFDIKLEHYLNKYIKIFSKFIFFIRNCNNYSIYRIKNVTDIISFDNQNFCWGIEDFIKKDEVEKGILYDNSENILIQDNESMIGIYICIYEDEEY